MVDEPGIWSTTVLIYCICDIFWLEGLIYVVASGVQRRTIPFICYRGRICMPERLLLRLIWCLLEDERQRLWRLTWHLSILLKRWCLVNFGQDVPKVRNWVSLDIRDSICYNFALAALSWSAFAWQIAGTVKSRQVQTRCHTWDISVEKLHIWGHRCRSNYARLNLRSRWRRNRTLPSWPWQGLLLKDETTFAENFLLIAVLWKFSDRWTAHSFHGRALIIGAGGILLISRWQASLYNWGFN